MSTTLPLTIGTTNFQSIVKKYQYTTSLTPVYGKTYTNLNMVERTNIVRWRGGLEIDTNYFTQANLDILYTALRQAPVTVTYYNFQLGAEVTQTMKFEADSIHDEFNSLRIGGKIKFTEL